MKIAAIETRYAGCRFRSRLEARWAVFFDHLGIRWEYEPEGFELAPLSEERISMLSGLGYYGLGDEERVHLGSYLPDFWLPQQEAWLEIKGTEPSERDWKRFVRFSLLVDHRAFLVAGNIPDPRTIDSAGHPYGADFEIHTYGDHHYAWTRCLRCGLYDITFDARSARTRCGCHRKAYPGISAPCCNGDKCYNGDDLDIIAAYTAARSARFEHGESGA
ncbi:hypothetical protein Ssi03_25680 [Sphaerisporangium siamense]|uniref:Uncharacterized protein n=1 Tax=Sphaerisporangium siamense TaxID=795645 RepID=A0A7W7GAK9_9ACTN|nr:hypothetical protein [Sphaerisporangium siamense]MBB4700106.1 hypothetical protein [Sphaerisporangium siamense]GII84578.1 hypothetical protein Ssi03_25680 [Sphaerisporangium siamense]